MKLNRKKIILFLSLFVLSAWIISCATAPGPPPLPQILEIVPPSTSVSPNISVFSGIWEGRWGGMKKMESIIVIEKIDNTSADILLSFSGPEPGYINFTGDVLSGPVIKWQMDKMPPPMKGERDNVECPCIITFEINKEFDIMISYMEFKEYNFKIRGDFKRRNINSR